MSSTGPLEQAKPTCDVGPFISESGPIRTKFVVRAKSALWSEADLRHRSAYFRV